MLHYLIMKHSRMSKIYNSKIFWMILSLLASLVLWAYISNQDTTSISKQLTGIQVQFSGEDLLREERNLAISDVDTTSVNVWIRGSRRAIGALDGSQVVAVIDVSKITQAGDMSWSYTIKYPAGTDTGSITTISRSPEIIGFTVSALSSKSVEVAGSFAGSLAEGYSAEDPTFEPSTVTVTGSEAALTKIAGAKVVFGKDKTDVKESFSVDTGYTLVDADGNPVSTTGLTFSTELIKATLPIMAELVEKVGSRYLLVNLVSSRARDLSAIAEEEGVIPEKKPVSAAIDEVYTGKLTIEK